MQSWSLIVIIDHSHFMIIHQFYLQWYILIAGATDLCACLSIMHIPRWASSETAKPVHCQRNVPNTLYKPRAHYTWHNGTSYNAHRAGTGYLGPGNLMKAEKVQSCKMSNFLFMWVKTIFASFVDHLVLVLWRKIILWTESYIRGKGFLRPISVSFLIRTSGKEYIYHCQAGSTRFPKTIH